MSDPSPADTPEPTGTPDATPAETAASSGGGRRRAAVFVITFLVTTFVLLTAFQFLTQSIWMQRYLFTVAGHTAIALDWVTDSSYLEFRSEHELPMEQQGQIRAEIDAWREGREPPNLPADERAAGPPLSRWEWFQHRTLKEHQDTAEEEAIIEALTANARPDGFDNPQQHIAFLVERADVIEGSIYRPLPGGGTRERADGQALRLYREARDALDRVTAGAFVLTEESFQVLLHIDRTLEEAWQHQLVFAQRRLGYLHQIVANSGPLVVVVWNRGTRGELEEARLALTKVNTDPGLDDSARADRAQALRADIRGLEQRLAEELREGAPAETIEGKRFRFTVIPECGAIETMVIYIAAILGFPALWWKRLAGIVLGIPLLYAVNIFRLACLGLIGAWFQDEAIFDFAHHYVWQAIYLVFVVIVWLLWMELFVRRGEKSSAKDT